MGHIFEPIFREQVAGLTPRHPDTKLLPIQRHAEAHEDLDGAPRVEEKVGRTVSPAHFDRLRSG